MTAGYSRNCDRSSGLAMQLAILLVCGNIVRVKPMYGPSRGYAMSPRSAYRSHQQLELLPRHPPRVLEKGGKRSLVASIAILFCLLVPMQILARHILPLVM